MQGLRRLYRGAITRAQTAGAPPPRGLVEARSKVQDERAVRDEHHPMLAEAAIMAAILQEADAAANQGTTLTAAQARLLADLKRAGEPLALTARELNVRLMRARHHLQSAGLLQRAPMGAFRITPRGQQVLISCPTGIDSNVLKNLRECRATLQATVSGTGPSADPIFTDYDAGYDAFDQGLSPLDNPHDADTSAHLAWEQGWFEARDDRSGTD